MNGKSPLHLFPNLRERTMDNLPPPFRLAKKASILSEYRIKVGAVLVDKKPICSGYNKLKTHPRFANPESNIKLSIHAEIACLLKMKFKDTSGLTVYVYRESNGHPAMSRPCKDCMNELRLAGIKKIFYSVSSFPYYKVEAL